MLNELIEGVYELAEWHIDGEIVTPPRIDGRFVLRDGAAITILTNSADPQNPSSAAFFGSYRLSADGFAYGYASARLLMQGPEGLIVVDQLPWEGMRDFDVEHRDGQVALSNARHAAEFVFDAQGFAYLEKGVLQRRWRRLISH